MFFGGNHRGFGIVWITSPHFFSSAKYTIIINSKPRAAPQPNQVQLKSSLPTIKLFIKAGIDAISHLEYATRKPNNRSVARQRIKAKFPCMPWHFNYSRRFSGVWKAQHLVDVVGEGQPGAGAIPSTIYSILPSTHGISSAQFLPSVRGGI